MPYTPKQCRYFAANPDKAPADWKKYCTKDAQQKALRRKKKKHAKRRKK